MTGNYAIVSGLGTSKACVMTTTSSSYRGPWAYAAINSRRNICGTVGYKPRTWRTRATAEKRVSNYNDMYCSAVASGAPSNTLTVIELDWTDEDLRFKRRIHADLMCNVCMECYELLRNDPEHETLARQLRTLLIECGEIIRPDVKDWPNP